MHLSKIYRCIFPNDPVNGRVVLYIQGTVDANAKADEKKALLLLKNNSFKIKKKKPTVTSRFFIIFS